jgi:hypothetical protein
MRALLLCLTLSGCATCAEHPVACSVSVALLAGSIAATANAQHHGSSPPATATIQPVVCAGGVCQ